MTVSLCTLAEQRRIRHSNIAAFMAQAVTLKEYCDQWVPRLYDTTAEQRGYHKLCVKELARITGYKEGSIHNWGAEFAGAPDAAIRMCAMASILNNVSTDWSDFVG